MGYSILLMGVTAAVAVALLGDGGRRGWETIVKFKMQPGGKEGRERERERGERERGMPAFSCNCATCREKCLCVCESVQLCQVYAATTTSSLGRIELVV